MTYTAQNLSGALGAVSVDTKRQLGRGATAAVFAACVAGSSRPYAAKIYHPDRRVNADKVRAMLANPPSNLDTDVAGLSYPQLAWPVALLSDRGGHPVGYLMPALDLSGAYSLDSFYDQTLFKKLNSPSEAAFSYKLEIARNLSLLVADLHQHGHCFIDMKPQNIRVLLGSHVVTLLDCDGFAIASPDGKRFPAELVSTDYIAPEAMRGNLAPMQLGEEQDRYALAVILFQLLNRGTHPFQGILRAPSRIANTNDEKAAQGLYPHGLVANPAIEPRPQSIHHFWHDGLRALFDKAFIGEATTRPSAREWANLIDDLLRNKTLTRCERQTADVAHIHFAGKGCPACYLQGLPGVAPTLSPPGRPAPKPSPTPTQANRPAQGASVPSAPSSSVHQTGSDPGFVFKVLFGTIAILFIIPFVIVLIGGAIKEKSTPTPSPAQTHTGSPPTNPKECNCPAGMWCDEGTCKPFSAGSTIPTKSAATQNPEQIEARAWAAAEKGGSRAHFQRYLDRYPNGRYALLARNRIGSAPAAAAPAQATESSAWAAAQSDGSPNAYTKFLKTYPNSVFAPLARVRAGQ